MFRIPRQEKILFPMRNELKFYISSASARLLESRLKAVLSLDTHTARNGGYEIRSLYFDSPGSAAFLDKVNGLEKREKYRVRFYNRDTDFLRLEKKEKVGNRSVKSGATLTFEEVYALMRGSTLPSESNRLVAEMTHRIRHEGYAPLLFVDYTRKAFLYPAGNVRITLDSALYATPFRSGLLDDRGRIPVLENGTCILEVKFDSFLPPFISRLLDDVPKVICAISKYCKCYEILY